MPGCEYVSVYMCAMHLCEKCVHVTEYVYTHVSMEEVYSWCVCGGGE